MICPRPILAALLSCATLAAQEPSNPGAANTQEPTTTQQKATTPQKLAWPRDRERVVCRVDGTDYTLEDMLRHIQERHYPDMLALMETAGGRAYFGHPLMASWVRHFADVVALEAEALRRGTDYEDAREELGHTLKLSFEEHLAGYVAQREKSGSPVELTQERINLLLTNYQRDHGLAVEVRGWLRVLVPVVPIEQTERIRDFYQDHPQWFGGIVTVSQILVQHRDPRTLGLKTGKELERAWSRLADVRARLLPDGSNFEEVARLLSEDRRTARNGGRLDGIRRFDERLPAALCRAAWKLRDGEISEPFESPFGIHVVKRIGYQHLYYVIFNDQVRGEVADTMRKSAQEDLLFEARERAEITLRY